MSEVEVENVFARLRWPQTDGKPVCPKCDCQVCYDCRRAPDRPRWRCKACRADFSVTSGTLFAWHKLPLRIYLMAIAVFCNEVKGKSMLAFCRDLDVQPAWRLADGAVQQRWLVDGLWSEQAVGIIGGEPKCGKSFLALDLAVAVAAGIPCLRRFAVSHPGRVLLYPAEDALHIVRRRLEGICFAAGVGLAELDVQVITAPSLRLDLEADRTRLEETVARLKPRLLVLDPFVRLHRIDENASGDVRSYRPDRRASGRR
ncbi:MAG: AAA family ATPase, partial [Rhodopila sp.]